MYTAKLFSLPEYIKVNTERDIIDVYAPYDIFLSIGQMKSITLGDFRMELSDDVLAVPFIDKHRNDYSSCYHELYFPKGFVHKRSCSKINLYVRPIKHCLVGVEIKEGNYLGSYKLMTSQFYKLNSKHDGSDRGLRSAYINIELSCQ